jgi:hypothetical protein
MEHSGVSAMLRDDKLSGECCAGVGDGVPTVQQKIG